MVVQHNLKAMNSNRMLGLTTASQAKSTEKLSSGYKINRAADDAAGLAISEKMRRQIRGLQRMNELAVKAANGTNQSVDRAYIQLEVKALKSEIDRVSQTTTFNERALLDGTFKSVALQVGAEGTSSNQIKLTIKSINTAGLSLTNTTVSTDASARTAITSIKNAIKTLNEQRANLGAVQNRLEHTINNLDNVVENTTAAESQIRDTDMASEMVKFSNNNILMQAGQAMLAQANQSNQGVMSLLQ